MKTSTYSKSNRLSLALAVCAFLLMPLAVHGQDAAPTRIGFVNAERLFSEAEASKAAQNKLKQEFSGRERQLLTQANTLKKAIDQFEQDAPKMPEDQRNAKQQQLMAQDRKIVEEAYAGDIIGVFDPGIFSIGDTICMPDKKFEFQGIPTFAPEHFARVRQIDTMKRKQFVKGINQIAQEGAIQIFQEFNTGMEEIIVGVVGVLQFDVLKYRLENEYNVEVRLDKLPYSFFSFLHGSLQFATKDITYSPVVDTWNEHAYVFHSFVQFHFS